MSNKLEILKNSLAKKEVELSKKFEDHFADVKRANGQPLNDKRNGPATFKRWEKQGVTITNLQASIQKTKEAIEKEEWKIKNVESTEIPSAFKELMEQGKITQWRKYPNRFFVVGVEKARIIWDNKSKKILCQYHRQIPNQEQYEIFKTIIQQLNKKL